MPTITFKAKPKPVYQMDGSLAYHEIKVPAIKTHHCDMAAFRSDKKYGGFANSDLFPAMIKRGLIKAGIRAYIHTDCVPDNVTIDNTGFLHTVTIDLE